MSQSASQNASTTSGQSSNPARATELASLKIRLRAALRQFPDFPSPGILFEDILPIFADPTLHEALLRSLELHISEAYHQKPDVIVGLDARGFLFGPSLALRLGASFVPVRKQGKLPGPCETEAYEKEYGQDFFQMQADAVKKGQTVLVVDDIIATGMFFLSFSLRYNILLSRRNVTNTVILQEARQPLLDRSSRNSEETSSALSLFSNSISSRDETSFQLPFSPFFTARRGSPRRLMAPHPYVDFYA
jgi:adenine phosphoribosyltransferase